MDIRFMTSPISVVKVFGMKCGPDPSEGTIQTTTLLSGPDTLEGTEADTEQLVGGMLMMRY
ncbi:hypothetical protein CCACVL1_06879 [Corchorus capsularis]|uniref:Uncharacterized protein n=1 Tax=Corchorus capsularis TaxID=210143 RepID=A0A1R3JC00_COCAP|nr:hypothetical protein CCACVL1_06879 [Corchorus capsularis]